MPYRRQYYDPFVEPVAPVAFVERPEPIAEVAPTTTQQQPITGLYVERGGIYLHTSDVVAALIQMAEEANAIEQPMTPRETLLAAAASFDAIHPPDES